MMEQSKEILKQLDSLASEYKFPMLDNGNFYLIGTRLNMFQKDQYWGMIIETVTYNPRVATTEGVMNLLFSYGNVVKNVGFSNNQILYPVKDDDPNIPFIDPSNELLVNKDCRYILLRDMKLAFFQSEVIRNVVDILRELIKEHRAKFFATSKELAILCLTEDIPLIKVFDEWLHPDISNKEKPGDSVFFQKLAQAIVNNNVANFKYVGETNTHWKNWPYSGTL